MAQSLAPNIQVYPDEDALMAAAAREVVSRLSQGTSCSRVVLPGGRTPVPLFDHLARSVKLDWRRVCFTFSDERCVEPTRADSNYRSARKALLDPLGIPESQILRLRGEDPPERAAAKAHAALTCWAQRVPLFDLVILGMGADAHVASLLPASEAPDFGCRLAAATLHPGGQPRISLTPRALRSSAGTMILVTGESKAEAVRDTLAAPPHDPLHPARLVEPEQGSLQWLLDAGAASLLEGAS
mgnify:CR=1 FL=1